MAAKISSFTVTYCDLRSSSGTCIFGLLFKLIVRFPALAGFRGQSTFFVEIQAVQDTRLHFLVTEPAPWANHCAIITREFKLVSVAAQPGNQVCRICDYQGVMQYDDLPKLSIRYQPRPYSQQVQCSVSLAPRPPHLHREYHRECTYLVPTGFGTALRRGSLCWWKILLGLSYSKSGHFFQRLIYRASDQIGSGLSGECLKY